MCSTKAPIALNPCASVKLVPYKPIRPTKMQCWMHPRRATCRARRLRNAYHNERNESGMLHATVYSNIFLDERGKPYYRKMLRKRSDAVTARHAFVSAGEVHDCMLIEPAPSERFKSIEEAGETNMTTLKIIINTLVDALGHVAANEYLLVADRLFIDMVYSEFRAIVLPQHAYILKQACPAETDSESDDDNERCVRRVEPPWNQIVELASVASADRDGDARYNEWQRQSQYIYRSFLVYVTMLTVILKQSNPFIISENSSVSVILRSLGKCPDNPERVKCCKLSFGGAPPGHVMCPPRAIIKKIYSYANWALNPQKDRRYSALIARPPESATGGKSKDLRENINNDLHADDITPLNLLDWDNFVGGYMDYFGATPSAQSTGI
ncbi:viral capsid associated protein [Choristoneura fumiferana DEF multiple nucleopolyhedrovirus]|uniref:Viral capsid associated protein n=1 Tax=Choristoneura fumiferana defective polyhedrosis virus TaxID=74660 RepID=Q6VTT8_NPVCD|nr:viral capsid associated protein [Choristoneura fumiferana DEF multiple nucleopolyhedrovirus]AAQ91662.1 viral capsid associated protein [Choristoneura fumiferana DEF multiple nucleopolyhedrovirus]